jgi:5-methylcytosine-specific restriction enzyme subunit McrC
MVSITIREFGRLTTESVETRVDQAQVSASAFDWLCRENSRLSRGGASLVQIDDRRWLRLDNYVGVIETPCGTRIEILPKHVDDVGDPGRARRLLRKMLCTCLNLTPREFGPASIEAFESPLTEWLARQFLLALDELVKRGVRYGYHAEQDEQRFLRGQLQVARQLRQPAGRQHRFRVEYDVFDANRAENRLLRSALERVFRMTRDATNWRLSRELTEWLSIVPLSTDIPGDFRRWGTDRLMAHYQPVRPWCALILGEQSPLSLLGEWRGLSLLFPMEKLFERYVEVCLRRQLPPGAVLQRTPSTEFLCRHLDQPWFRLEPDLLLTLGPKKWVIDTKWKRLDAALSNASDKYKLSQSDFYQLFAYGQQYLAGKGEMLLVFPRTSSFQAALPGFEYTEDLRIHVVPFDLEAGSLAGEWLVTRGQPLQMSA